MVFHLATTEIATRRMAQRFGVPPKVEDNAAGYEPKHVAGSDDAAAGPLAKRWQDFLAGPRLPSVPTLTVIALASVVPWAGIIWLTYYIVHL